MTLSIIVPAYNEFLNLPILIREININLKNKLIYEIIIVDDCSKDLTQKLYNDEFFNNCSFIKNDIKLGQSFSIIKGIKNAKYNTIATIDADLQNNPRDILKLFDFYTSDKDLKLVGGLRKKRKDSLIKIISSKIANKIRVFFLKDKCEDTGCSLKIFDKNIFLTFPKFDGIHRFLPALFNGFHYKTKFVDVDHRLRIHGVSNYGTLSRMLKGIRDIIKVKNIISNKNK